MKRAVISSCLLFLGLIYLGSKIPLAPDVNKSELASKTKLQIKKISRSAPNHTNEIEKHEISEELTPPAELQEVPPIPSKENAINPYEELLKNNQDQERFNRYRLPEPEGEDNPYWKLMVSGFSGR